jgi:hypothetical protein
VVVLVLVPASLLEVDRDRVIEEHSSMLGDYCCHLDFAFARRPFAVAGVRGSCLVIVRHSRPAGGAAFDVVPSMVDLEPSYWAQVQADHIVVDVVVVAVAVAA